MFNGISISLKFEEKGFENIFSGFNVFWSSINSVIPSTAISRVSLRGDGVDSFSDTRVLCVKNP